MCGRYFIDDETSKEIKKILQQIDKKSATCYYLISKYHYNFPKITEG